MADGTSKCIDDEIPFEIPESWEWSRLSNLIKDTNAGKSPNCDKTPRKGNQWGVLTTTAIQLGSFHPEENKVLPPDFKVQKEQEVKYEDILITRAGPRNRTGIVCVVDKPCDNLILSDKTVRIDYLREFCNPYFLMDVLNSPGIHENVMRATVGMAASQVNISQDSIKKILIPVPPREEQLKIVDILTSIQPVIDRYERAQNNLDKLNFEIKGLLKKSILQEAIQGKLVPQNSEEGDASGLLRQIELEKQKLIEEGKLKKKDLVSSTIFRGDDNKYFEKLDNRIIDISEEIPFEIPSTWKWCRFSQIAELYTGNSISETEKKLKFDGVTGMPYIGTKDVSFDCSIDYQNGIAIPDLEIQKFRVAKKNTILMCIEGGSAGRKIAIINQDVCFGNKLCCFDPYINIVQYLFYYMQAPMFIEQFHANKVGIIGGVSVNSIKNMLVAIPPIDEQKRIVDKIVKLSL